MDRSDVSLQRRLPSARLVCEEKFHPLKASLSAAVHDIPEVARNFNTTRNFGLSTRKTILNTIILIHQQPSRFRTTAEDLQARRHLKRFVEAPIHCSSPVLEPPPYLAKLLGRFSPATATIFSRLDMDSADQEDFDSARFATVLRNLKRDRIPSFASAVRYSGHRSTCIIDVPTTPRPVTCRLLSRTTCGSFNAVFQILFADGTLWVLKVPANGHGQCWDGPAREALTSEALTMRLIRRRTTIPVSEVFAYDATLENELGCPFILMEFIHGKPLNEVWFTQGVSQPKREQIRTRALQGIAEAMTQLNSFAFSQGGSLLFDAKGNVAGIGSSNVVDLETQYAKMHSKDYDNTMTFCQHGPFADPNSYLPSLLDAREEKGERCEVEEGAYKLLRLFIEWSVTPGKTEEKPFVLAHADLDYQNILVNNDGSLAGIIDWDGVAAVPRYIGCQSFPKFLTQDYDPAKYAYDVDAGKPIEGYLADSPAELACYRAMYAQFMESYLSIGDQVNLIKSRQQAAHVRKSRKYAADLTRGSLVTTTLHLAAKAPSVMKRPMVHLFDQIEELTAAHWQEEFLTTDCGSEDDIEKAGEKDADTEQSEVDGSDIVRKDSCTDSTESEEQVTNINHLSIDELMDEIENLANMSSVGSSDRDVTLGSADVEESPSAESIAANLGVEHQGSGAKEHMDGAQVSTVARGCKWFMEKVRRGAKSRLKKCDPNASADSLPKPKSASATRKILGWTESKLHRVADCLHCGNDDHYEAKGESKTESMSNRGVDVLQRLQKKLEHLRAKLHHDNLSTPYLGGGEVSQKEHVTCVPRELTRAEKRAVCGKLIRIMQEKRIHLTVNQQASVAHWIIQTLQDPDASLDLGDGAVFEEGQDGGKIEPMVGPKGKEGTGEREIRLDAKDHLAPIYQSYITQSSEDAGTMSDAADPKETSGATADSNDVGFTQEDLGDFDLVSICVALARENLDERRMQRLREGFFGLLNQTL